MQIKPSMLWSSRIFPLLIILLIATSISAQEVDDEREFDYVKGSEKGPEHWGEIKKEWATCNTGELQSPIDLFHRRVTMVPKWAEISKSYRLGKAVLRNRGHHIEIEWKDKNSKIQIHGTDYILKQSHWHSPSEHKINGTRFDMELHMVHQSKDGKTAVIGLLYKIGKPNEFFRKLMKKIKTIPESDEEVDAGMINPDEIKMEGKKYYRYIGSLTTPPCTEGVPWTVNKQIGTVSRKQLTLLKEAVHDHAENNARPLQELNGRKVKFYVDEIKNNPY